MYRRMSYGREKDYVQLKQTKEIQNLHVMQM